VQKLHDRGFLGRKVQENEMPFSCSEWVRWCLPEQATGRLSQMSLPTQSVQELLVCGACGSARWGDTILGAAGDFAYPASLSVLDASSSVCSVMP